MTLSSGFFSITLSFYPRAYHKGKTGRHSHLTQDPQVIRFISVFPFSSEQGSSRGVHHERCHPESREERTVGDEEQIGRVNQLQCRDPSSSATNKKLHPRYFERAMAGISTPPYPCLPVFQLRSLRHSSAPKNKKPGSKSKTSSSPDLEPLCHPQIN